MVRTLTLLLLLVAGVQVAYYYPQLPEYIASNFGGKGQAQAWMPKALFFAVSTGMMLLIGVLFVWLGSFLRRMPIWLVNLPHREYWFAEVRKEETLARLDAVFGWVGVSTLVLTVVVCQLVIQANLNPPPRLSDVFLWILLLYMAGIAWSVVWIFRTFSKIPEE